MTQSHRNPLAIPKVNDFDGDEAAGVEGLHRDLEDEREVFSRLWARLGREV